MEFSPEIDEGSRESGAKTSDAPLPDLHVGSETRPKERVKEPDVSQDMLPKVDKEPEIHGPVIERERDAPHGAEMAHIEGEPLSVRYK